IVSFADEAHGIAAIVVGAVIVAARQRRKARMEGGEVDAVLAAHEVRDSGMVWSAALGFPGEIGRFECRRRDDEHVIPGAADKPIIARTAVEHVVSVAAF